MWHEGTVIFLSGMVENVGSSVEGIYFVVLGWCEIGLLMGYWSWGEWWEILIIIWLNPSKTVGFRSKWLLHEFMFGWVFDEGNYFVSISLVWDKSVWYWIKRWWIGWMLMELKSGWLVGYNFKWEWLSINKFVVR